MSRLVRTLLLTQLLVAHVGLAVIAPSPLGEPLTATPSMPEVVRAAVARPAPRPVVKPAAKPAARPQPAPRKHVVRTPHRRTTHVVSRPHIQRTPTTMALLVTGASAQQQMERAVARIPGYIKGSATWVLAANDGYWGTADWYQNTIYISPKVPATRMYDVVAHEWSHLRSVQVYGGDVAAAMVAMGGFFGGTGLAGSERAADCMARQLGAVWTHYSPCGDAQWQSGAAQLLSGQRL